MAIDDQITATGPGPNLPPVQPPSGRFIAQLFLVPGLIVLFVVLLVLAINYMFVGGQTPEQFLARLDSNNSDIRWRGANDLAQVLKRKESLHLRTDVGFALDLAQRLDKAVNELAADEKAIADKLQKADPTGAAFRRLDTQRNYVMFLAASLGDFHFAAGVPVLSKLVLDESSPDPIQGAMRRRQALWSLANLGENVRSYRDLKPEYQNLILSKLRMELDSEFPVRKAAARNALHYAEPAAKEAGPEVIRVDQVLAKAATAEDQFLRSQVALAFNFWDGPAAAPTLLLLSRDDGFGTMVRTPEEK